MEEDFINMKCKLVVFLFFTVLAGFFIMAPADDAQAYLGDRVLKLHMQGYDVQQLQKDLNYLGYQAGTVDGIFGSQTLKAVKEFQSRNGLSVDGIVGRQTALAIINQVSTPATAVPGSNVSRGFLSNLTQDLNYLARLVYGEARGESFEGQVAVAAVVLNRVRSSGFGNTIRSVIFEPGAFTAVSDKQYYLPPDSTAYKAAQAALNGWDPTGGALYYWNPRTATSKWVWTRNIINKIGNHVFAI
jgi:N-acetylmuramoyl-L-alanine amidase